MPDFTEPTRVVIINSIPDLVRRLRLGLEEAGFVVFIVHIEDIKQGLDVRDFLREHDPRVVVYDVPPPYDLNWRTMWHLRSSPDFVGRHFVLTTVNLAALEKAVGKDETVYEVLGEREDIDAVVRAVREAARARPTR
jgi:hypothetical protein